MNTPTAPVPATPTTVGASAAIAISDYAFAPTPLTVVPGTTVMWTNRDAVAHTVSADDGSWGSGALATGATYSHVFTQAGTYTYHCAIHPGMTGTIIVAP